MYDLIIIGGGPAAIAAGIYAGRKKLKTLLIVKNWGGQMALTSVIENYPGFESILGMELTEKMKEQLEKYHSCHSRPPAMLRKAKRAGESGNPVPLTGFPFSTRPPRKRSVAGRRERSLDSRVKPENDTITIKENAEVLGVEKGEIIEVKTNSGDYQSRALIIAHGRIPKKLNIPGEDKFKGKGLSYCVHCDGPFFKDKDVAVIGGGNAGLEAALDLVNHAKKIYLLEFMPQLAADEVLQERLKEFSQIEVITNTAVKEIKGEKFISALVYEDRNNEETKELAVEGVFSEIGWIANSSFLKGVVELNQSGEIKIDAANRTSQPNIFAAGDITDIPEKQIIIAAGEGAKAALSAYRYLKS
jgi:alkyl hydroperoxide reductase subunit F